MSQQKKAPPGFEAHQTKASDTASFAKPAAAIEFLSYLGVAGFPHVSLNCVKQCVLCVVVVCVCRDHRASRS